MSEVSAQPSSDPTATARPETSNSDRPSLARGTAPIKQEYLINTTPVVEESSSTALNNAAPYSTADDEAEGSTSGPQNKKNKKANRGQNKARQFPTVREAGPKICRSWEKTGSCDRGVENCKFCHSWEDYFTNKPDDIHFNPTAKLKGEPDYVESSSSRKLGGESGIGKTLDLDTTCPVLKDLGYCPYGWRCRFLGGHISKDDGEGSVSGWKLGCKTDKEDEGSWRNGETNWPDHDLIRRLRSNEYPFPISEKYLHHIEPHKPFTMNRDPRSGKGKKRPNESPYDNRRTKMNGTNGVSEENGMNEAEMMNGSSASKPASGLTAEEEAMNLGSLNGDLGKKGVIDGEVENLDVPLRPEEKRSLKWENGLYLAPLTTTGNLPFRRLCVDYGATITCSEMALAQPLVSGHNEEWALVRRHQSEKMFGIQLAGGYANRMVPTAEMISREIGNGIDFVDVNLGCPIDLVFNQGAGSALMDSPGRLGKILVGMNRALGEIPLTVKFRTGVASNKPNAHKLVPRFGTEWGASAMTLHGRSRQQRYSKLADWEYIKQCADTLRSSLSDAGLPPVPIFGNGDCFSAQSYYEEKEKSGVDGVMIARGALIKPWIFTEVAERREWDISATERLEGIRKYAEYGLSHWGSDTQGVSITRRFLCEALSFQHRYIPIGLLERLPPMMNERPPAYRGRNELETLLSSPFAGDWVKISELFLGPAEDSWKFTPKHKSNAYGSEEAQG